MYKVFMLYDLGIVILEVIPFRTHPMVFHHSLSAHKLLFLRRDWQCKVDATWILIFHPPIYRVSIHMSGPDHLH